MRRAASTLARKAAAMLAIVACCACSGAGAGSSTRAEAAAPSGPIWTAQPSGTTKPRPTPPPSPMPDAATRIELSGKYTLVYRASDPSFTDTFTAGLSTRGLKPRTAARDVWDANGQAGGMVVVDLVGMDLPDESLKTVATAFAEKAKAEVDWTTVLEKPIAVLSDGTQQLDLFLLDGDLVIVAGVDAETTDDIAKWVIIDNT